MSSREETYCVKERKYTKNINHTIKTSKNGNKYIQSTCFICGNKKSSFIKSLRQGQRRPKNGSNNRKSKSNKNKLSEGVAKNSNGKSVFNIKDFFYKKIKSNIY